MGGAFGEMVVHKGNEYGAYGEMAVDKGNEYGGVGGGVGGQRRTPGSSVGATPGPSLPRRRPVATGSRNGPEGGEYARRPR